MTKAFTELAATSALKETIEDEQGYDPAALMVLHTWNQRLDAHAHVHAIVPGGGPSLAGRSSLSGGGWVTSQRPGVADSQPYLVDAIDLRRSFRSHFIKALRRLHGELKLTGEFANLRENSQWEEFLEELEGTEWVSYIQPPPTDECRTEHVLKYLARYLTGGPISDARIIAADEREVTFWAREGTVTGGERGQIPLTLSVEEFTRRWSLHVLPKGYTKTRRWGGWSNNET
jgi:hypothetical protein